MTNGKEILPGLVLDDELYEAAAAGIAEFAPEHAPLTRERFTTPTEWAMIPDEHCDLVKAEMVLSRSIEATRKINIWFAPDLRGDAFPLPHSHSWFFESHVLLNGLTEDRYDTNGDQVTTEYNVAHRFGTSYQVPKHLYHEVTDIHGEPGRAMTLMVCGVGKRGDWGYLDVDTGAHRQIEPDPDFSKRF